MTIQAYDNVPHRMKFLGKVGATREQTRSQVF